MNITISQYRLATSRKYRNNLLGRRVTYTTLGGNTVTGTITERPINAGGLYLAVTTDSGQWAAITAGDTVTVAN